MPDCPPPPPARPRRWPGLWLGVGLGLLGAPMAIAAPDTPAVSAPPVAPLPAQLADLDAYAEDVRKTFQVPGIAVAIVKDGEIVMAKGWGEREIGKGPVDGHTLFAIASNTKAFTATALNMLAEEGKLSLDDRVVDRLPWFQMADPYVTREMRIRDLLAHRSGLSLGAGDLLYWPTTDYTTREVAERLRHVPLKGSFRDRYAYDNILYAVAQLVVAPNRRCAGRPQRRALPSMRRRCARTGSQGRRGCYTRLGQGSAGSGAGAGAGAGAEEAPWRAPCRTPQRERRVAAQRSHERRQENVAATQLAQGNAGRGSCSARVEPEARETRGPTGSRLGPGQPGSHLGPGHPGSLRGPASQVTSAAQPPRAQSDDQSSIW